MTEICSDVYVEAKEPETAIQSSPAGSYRIKLASSDGLPNKASISAHSPDIVVNAVGVVEFWDGKIAYFYCSRTQAHGHDVCTEITGKTGKMPVNVVPGANNVVLADKLGIRHEVQPEYWQRFEDAFLLEANGFTDAVLKD